MASVCGSTLSLMDAGVPIKAPVAGIAMGLIKEGDDYVVLTDIAGVEDHLGDMDFKVAGTEEGITALQMDIKITGVTFEILRDALHAGPARRACSSSARWPRSSTRRASEMSEYAPRISSIKIDPDKIGLLIGKGGETIRSLQEEYEAQIDVDDTGQVRVYAPTGAQGDALVDRIRSMTKEVEIGDTFTGKVVKTMPFGAFVELAKGTDGLLHISNVAPGQRARDGRGGPREGPGARGPRGRGRPRARPHRPAPRRRPGGRGQVRGGAGRRRLRRPWPARRRRPWRRRGRGGRGGGGAAATATGAAAGATATAAARAARRPRPRPELARCRPPHHRAALRPAHRHRAHGRRPLRGPGLLRGHRLARRDRRRGRPLALPRAPAVQGHRPLRVGRDRPAVRRLGRRAQRRHRQGVARPSTRGCSTSTCRARST